MISVILATFNRKETLLKSINSVLKQTFKDFELIIVDDASTVDTKNLLRSVLNADQRVKYYKLNHNKGPGLARNYGVSKAKYQNLSFIDSDDEYTADHLEKVIDLFENGHDLILSTKDVIGFPFNPGLESDSELIDMRDPDIVITGIISLTKPVFEQIGGFKDIRYGEDYELFHAAKKICKKFARIEKPTYLYYANREDSLSQQYYHSLVTQEEVKVPTVI